MKSLVARLASFIAVFATTMLVTGAASAAGPAYLAEMPSVAEVQRTVKGSTPLEQAGRQEWAFRQLCWTIRTLSEGGEFGDKMTAEERTLFDAYSKAGGEAATRCGELAAKEPNPKEVRMKYCRRSGNAILDDAFPRVEGLRADRKSADADAIDRIMNASKGVRGGKNAGILLLAGVVILVIGLGITVTASKLLAHAMGGTDALRREEFQRRTGENVLAFETFEAAEAHRMRRLRNSGEAILGLLMLLLGMPVAGLGALLIGVGVVALFS